MFVLEADAQLILGEPAKKKKKNNFVVRMSYFSRKAERSSSTRLSLPASLMPLTSQQTTFRREVSGIGLGNRSSVRCPTPRTCK